MLSPAYETPPPRDECNRREPRTSLFVLANLVANGAANRIKVRNISPTGALIEGPVLPRPGTGITLCRADVELTGRVMWSAGGRAGIRFEGRAVVGDWLPSTNAGQRAVDQAIELAQAEKRAGLLPATQAPLPHSAHYAADLTTMAALLDRLADELAGDVAVVSKYMSKLQILDIAAQTLRRCASEMHD